MDIAKKCLIMKNYQNYEKFHVVVKRHAGGYSKLKPKLH